MHLKVIELRRACGQDRSRWEPFANDDGFTQGWWHGRAPMSDDPRYLSALLDGQEVARAELDDNVSLGGYDTGSLLDPRRLEVVLLEVSTAYRRRSIATHLVGQIAALYPGLQLVALSEDADEFWASLGWDRVDRVKGSMRYRPLFIGPRSREDQAPGR